MKVVEVCSIQDIVLDSGRAALVDGQQVAIFRVKTGSGEQFFAIDNFCPFAKANVLSRGIVGSLKGSIVVASPIYKQHFDLQSGVCLEDATVAVRIWPISIEGDKILVTSKEQIVAA